MDPWEEYGRSRMGPHRAVIVWQQLQQLFPNHVAVLWAWPSDWIAPRSPDLTSCDLFLWGYLNNLVFKIVWQSFPALTAENHTWNTSTEMHQNDETCYALNGRKGQTVLCCSGAASKLNTVHHLCYAYWHSVVEWIGYTTGIVIIYAIFGIQLLILKLILCILIMTHLIDEVS